MSLRIAFGLVMLLLVVKLAISFSIAITDPLWLDELHTAWSVNGDWQQVSPRALAGNQSPLFFWIEKGVLSLGKTVLQAPDMAAALRLVSVLSGGALLGMASIFVWRATFSITATVCTGVLILIEPTLLFYSTEARPYALMQLIGLIQVTIFWLWLDRWSLLKPLKTAQAHDAKAYSVLDVRTWSLTLWSAFLINVHLTSIWLLIVEGIFLVGLVLYRQLHAAIKPAWRDLIGSVGLSLVVILILTIPVWPAATQVAHRVGNWSSFSSPENLLLEARTEIGWGMALPMLFVVFWGLKYSGNGPGLFDSRPDNLTGTLPAIENDNDRIRLKALLIFVFLWGAIPFGILVLLDAIQGLPFAARRYTLIGTTAFPVFSGLCIGMLPKQWIRMASLILILAANLFHQPWLFDSAREGKLPQLRTEDWFSVISEINQNEGQSGERSRVPVFLFANLLEDRQAFENHSDDFQNYLKFAMSSVPELEQGERAVIAFPTLVPNAFRKSDLELARTKNGAWLIIRGDETLIEEILNEIRSHADSDKGMSIESATFSQSPRSDVRLFWLGF